MHTTLYFLNFACFGNSVVARFKIFLIGLFAIFFMPIKRCVVWIVKVVNTIHLPLVEKANLYGVLLTKERAAHTHYAIFTEMKFAVLHSDVLCWANIHAAVAVDALRQNLVMLAIKAPTPMFDAKDIC